MPNIARIDAVVRTGDRSGAGTDGDIYLGIAGREFMLDSAIDDFERNSTRTYVISPTAGPGSSINNPATNNPVTPYQLVTENIDRFPAYIRFQPTGRDDNWNLESVTVTVNPGPNQRQLQALGGSNHLWLGVHSGLYCYLR